uniref:Secreted protein n=1 Tax=Chrysotila carterae TaxID=13221 RepID=A0A7S4F774_CHRCT
MLSTAGAASAAGFAGAAAAPLAGLKSLLTCVLNAAGSSSTFTNVSVCGFSTKAGCGAKISWPSLYASTLSLKLRGTVSSPPSSSRTLSSSSGVGTRSFLPVSRKVLVGSSDTRPR